MERKGVKRTLLRNCCHKLWFLNELIPQFSGHREPGNLGAPSGFNPLIEKIGQCAGIVSLRIPAGVRLREAQMASLLPNDNPSVAPQSRNELIVAKAKDFCHRVISRTSVLRPNSIVFNGLEV